MRLPVDYSRGEYRDPTSSYEDTVRDDGHPHPYFPGGSHRETAYCIREWKAWTVEYERPVR